MDNTKFKESFVAFKEGGKGGFGLCEKVLHKDSGLILIKKECDAEKIKPKHLKYIRDEASYLQKCKHDYVVKYYHSFDDGGIYYLYMELADKGDLHNYLKRIDHRSKTENKVLKQSKILRILTQMLLALKHIHNCGMMHRDIKDKNTLLYQDGTVKLCDFGISFNVQQSNPSTHIGDKRNIAPEVLKGNYHKEADIWSLGVVLYQLIHLKPFQTLGKMTSRHKVSKIEPRSGIDKELIDIWYGVLLIKSTKNYLSSKNDSMYSK